MMRCLPTLCCATLAIGAALGAQQQGERVVPDQRPPVTFRTETNFVEIDAIVTDRDGRFVASLTKDDFELFEEGQPQQISAFSLVQIPVRPATASEHGATLVEPDAASNRVPFTGRIFLLVLDDLHTQPTSEEFVRKTARTFIERHVAPGDLAAIFFTSSRTNAQDFTGSRARLLAAIDRFSATKLRSAGAVAADDAAMNRYVLPTASSPFGLTGSHVEHQISQAAMSMNVLAQMADFLGSIRGRRKSVVYFGEGNDYPNVFTVRTAVERAVAASTRANASIYTIDPRGLAVSGHESQRLLRSLAEQTQGLAFLNTNDTAGSLARIVEDSSSYYLLGYYAPDGRKPGRFRNVDVRVRRDGLTVRSRPGYYVPATERSSAAEKTSGARASPELQEALRSPLPANDLTFTASATPFQGKGPRASVALVVEIDPARIGFVERRGVHHADIELQVTATDPLAKPPISSTHHLAQLRMSRETYDAVRKEGVRIIRRIDLPAGRHRLQLGLRDKTSGAVGTLFTDLDVPDFTKPPLAISGIVLVSAAATRMPTMKPDEALSALLPGAHTARREFPLNDTLAVYADVYVKEPLAAAPVRVTSSVLDEQGREVFGAREEYPSEGLAGESGRRARSGAIGHRVTIPAADLGPGRFVLRIHAERGTGGDPVVREVAFAVR